MVRFVPVRRVLTIMVPLVVAGLGVSIVSARAAGSCPNEQLRAQDVYALGLPDCRAYEQVSPVEKNFSDAVGIPGLVQSSPSGAGVTFFGLAFPGVQGFYEDIEYLSSRGGEEWTTEGLTPPVEAELSALTIGWTEDLSRTFIDKVEPEREGKAAHDSVYIRDNATGSDQLLVPVRAVFVDATPGGSRVLFESEEELGVPGAASGVPNLYEWEEAKPPGERLSLAGAMANGKAPVGGSVGGPGGAVLGSHIRGGARGEPPFYTQDTISEDGSRVFFTEGVTRPEFEGKVAPGTESHGVIYMREPQAERTVQVSEGTAPAYWRAATPTGSFVVYTEGEDLYRYDVQGNAREALTSGAAGVLGTLGISDDGSYVYFVAEGVLPGTSGATAGKANLYQWREGSGLTFIATLSAGDRHDWSDFYLEAGPDEGFKGSRVAPNGETALFASVEKLTSYNNLPKDGKCETRTGGCDELYVYNGRSGLACVSCNPRQGVEVSGNAELGFHEAVHPDITSMFLTRNLSADGNRVFFQSKEALVPEDTNGVRDVYEWERAGTGSCASSSKGFAASSGGCLYLISTGQSSEESYFGDASSEGGSVFFFTRQRLVSQEQDNNANVYDAREDGGIAAQNPPPATPPCDGEESCREAQAAPSPVFGAPSSATFSGSGDLPPAASNAPVAPGQKALTRAQKLANALHACRKKSKKTRRTCESQARKKYGGKASKSSGKASRSARGQKSIRAGHS